MKTVENKTTTIPKGADEFAKYSDLLSSILNRPLQKLQTVKEMRRDIRLLDITEQHNLDIMQFEDEEFTYLKDLVINSEWHFKHRDILAFVDYIEFV